MIEDEHMLKFGENYLIDIPVVEKPDSTYVFFVNADIPVERLKQPSNFYPSINEFILIVPDRKYYQIIAEESTKQGIQIEPLIINNYYHIIRNGGEVKQTVRIYPVMGTHTSVILNLKSQKTC